MRKDLQAIKYLNDTCINFLDRTKELYCTVTFTRKRAEILRDNIAEVEQALNRLEAIDNAEPSEALMKLNLLLDRANHDEILSRKSIDFCEKWIKEIQEAYDTIKQALLKAQESKKYLKWEDLEFKEKRQTIKVRMGNTIYNLFFYEFDTGYKRCHLCNEEETLIYDIQEQFFNDLRLERVEE